MADVHHPNKPVRQCEARRLADMQGKSYAARTAIIRLSYMGGSCVFIVVREQGLEVVVGRTKTFNIYFKDKDQEVCRLTLHRTPSSCRFGVCATKHRRMHNRLYFSLFTFTPALTTL